MDSYYRLKRGECFRKDLTGQRFGRLVVKSMEYNPGGKTYVNCVCDCGNTIKIPNTYLTTGDTTSCGCYQKERAKECNMKDHTGSISYYGIEFIRKASQNNKGQWLWECRCGVCDSIFIALPAKVLNGHITSCGCAKRSSKERLISEFLDKHNIKYIPEKTFDDCKNIHKLRFDFYLIDFNYVIEYQGKQHYEPVSLFGGDKEYEQRVFNDSIKRKYCKEMVLIYLRYHTILKTMKL